MVKIHRFLVYIADCTFSIHKDDTFQYSSAHNLILHICLFIKGFINQSRKIETIRNQLTCNLQGFWWRIGIMKNPCIMNDTYIDCLCYFDIKVFLIYNRIDKFCCWACCWFYIIYIPTSLWIADVMINIDSLLCFIKKSYCFSKSRLFTIQCNKYIRSQFCLAIIFYLIKILDTGKYFWWLL